MWKMDPISGFDIRIVFTLPPRDRTLQCKRSVHLWNNFPWITTVIYLSIYNKVVISVCHSLCLSDHNLGTPGPICLNFLLGKSGDPKECSKLSFDILYWVGRLLDGKIAKIVIYVKAQVNGGTNNDYPGQRWVPKKSLFAFPIITREPLDQFASILMRELKRATGMFLARFWDYELSGWTLIGKNS